MERHDPGQRVLVPFDGSDFSAQAFPLALGLAAPGATVTLFHVQEGDDDRTSDDLPGLAAAMGGGGGVTVDHAVGRGDVPAAIVARARQDGAGLIVMSTRGHGGLTRMAFGSVTEDVIRSSDVPVAVVHEAGDAPGGAQGAAGAGARVPTRIILPLDGTDVSAGALPLASALAARLSIPVVVVSTLDLVPMSTPGMVQDAGLGTGIGEVYEESREAASGWLRSASDELGRAGVQSSTEFLAGSPGPAIEGLSQPGDLVVMATHGRRGIDRMLSGSVTDGLIRSGVVPVLVLPVGAQAG